MSRERTYTDYLRDMLAHAQQAQAFVQGMSFEQFAADARTLDYPGFTQFAHDEKQYEVEQLLRR
jgi:hypothetical protein